MPGPESTAAGGQAVLEAENFIETYRIIAEWIRFADAKAAVTLTVNGVVLSLVVPTLKAYLADKTALHPTAWWNTLVIGLFLVWMVLMILSGICSFLCVLPFRGQGRQMALSNTTHFHPAAVARSYSLADLKRFLADAEQIGTAGLKAEILTAILIDSHLSTEKYGYVARSIWFLAYSIALAFLYLLAIQF
jgi:hypothetical protein